MPLKPVDLIGSHFRSNLEESVRVGLFQIQRNRNSARCILFGPQHPQIIEMLHRRSQQLDLGSALVALLHMSDGSNIAIVPGKQIAQLFIRRIRQP